MDNFYKGLPEGMDPKEYDFDHPQSLDFNAINKCLRELLMNKKTHMPLYDFKKHAQSGEFQELHCKDILIFEGILSLYDEKIRNLFDLKLFILCDSDVALARRILRDIRDRGRDVNEVLTRYNKFIKKDYEKYVKPQMKYADVIIPGGASNDLAKNIISQHLLDQFEKSRSNIHKLDFKDQLKSRLIYKTQDSFSQDFVINFNRNSTITDEFCNILIEEKNEVVQKHLNQILNKLFMRLSIQMKNDLNLKEIIQNHQYQFWQDKTQELTEEEQEKIRFLVFFTFNLNSEKCEEIQKHFKSRQDIPIYIVSILSHHHSIDNLLNKNQVLKVVTFTEVNELEEVKKDLKIEDRIAVLESLSQGCEQNFEEHGLRDLLSIDQLSLK